MDYYDSYDEAKNDIRNKEQSKMTREDAVKMFNQATTIVEGLEKLGLIKFDEPKKEVKHCISIDINQFKPNMDIGVAKLELWPEGLVLWVGGEIVWKSWEPNRTNELVKKLAGEVKIKVIYSNGDIARGRIIE